MNNHSKYIQTSRGADWGLVAGILGGFLVFCVILIGVLSTEKRALSGCVTNGEWVVHERTTVRELTSEDHIYELHWDFELRCVGDPGISIVYRSSRPNWAQINSKVVFSPRVYGPTADGKFPDS